MSLQLSSSREPCKRSSKLRLSCNACAESKVRCEKQHPSCRRCVGNAITCVYGISRKHGKPSKKRSESRVYETSARDLARKLSPVRQNSHPCISEELIPDDSGIPFTPSWATNINLIDSAGKSWDQIATPFLSADSSPFVAEHAPSGPPTLLHTDSSCSTQTFNGQFETEDECSATPLSRDLQDFMGPENRCSAGTSLPFALTPPRKCSRAPLPCPDNPEKHCCYAIASSTLDSLHHESDCSTANVDTTSRSPAHVLQPRGSGPLSLTLDHILRQNKVAVRNVARLLACSCIHDPHLVMLCGSIISKVLLWYQAAAGVGSYPSSSEGLSQTFTASPFSFPRSGHATVALLPLTVGDFCLDEEDQETLGRQLLLSELGKLGQLIDRLREKHDEVGDQAHMDLGNLYMTLGRWLKSELVRTMREVDERGTGKRYLSEDRFRS